MKKNGFVPLIIILVITILGVVGYFGYKRYSPTLNITTLPFSIPYTNDWNEYQSDKYQFKFKYPKEWTVLYTGSIIDEYNNIPLQLTVGDKKEVHTISIWVYAPPDTIPGLYFEPLEDDALIRIGDKMETVHFFSYGYETYGVDCQKENCSYFATSVDGNNFQYLITGKGKLGLTEIDEIYLQILSTFIFTQ